MRIRNTPQTYGIINITLHWLMALIIPGLMVFGLWMVDLDYYDPWYKQGPDLHRSIGMIVLLLLLIRLGWRLTNPRPAMESGMANWEKISATLVHWAFYILLFTIITSGYLISTADGRPVVVFELFEISATLTSIPDQEDIAGFVHFYLAVGTVILGGLHALAALKHHFINKDETLRRMIGLSGRQRDQSGV